MTREHPRSNNGSKRSSRSPKSQYLMPVIGTMFILFFLPLFLQSKMRKYANQDLNKYLLNQTSTPEVIQLNDQSTTTAAAAAAAAAAARQTQEDLIQVQMKEIMQSNNSTLVEIKAMTDKMDSLQKELQTMKGEIQKVMETLKGDVIGIKDILRTGVEEVKAEMKNEVGKVMSDMDSKVKEVMETMTVEVEEIKALGAKVDETTNASITSSTNLANTITTETAQSSSEAAIITTETSTVVNDSCNFKNSHQWLNGTRLPNISEEEMTDEMIKNLIINTSPMVNEGGGKHVLEQTICSSDSDFVNWKPTITSNPHDTGENKDIRHLAFRLMFLALHEHQYGPARKEVISRYGLDPSCPTSSSNDVMSSLKTANIGKLDYECPDTKYVISAVPQIGFGAALRSGMQEAFFFGLMTGRVVLFLNSLDFASNHAFKIQLQLASCPRKDMQCIYMPISPCVITKEDYLKAPLLEKKEMRFFRNYGRIDEKYKDEKVIIIEPDLDKLKVAPPGVRETFVNAISSFYQQQSDTQMGKPMNPWNLDAATLTRVSNLIMDKGQELWLPNQVTTFYILRPNMQTKRNLANALGDIFPENFNPATAVGVPIRGSDKCGRNGSVGESTCMTFDVSMEMVKEFVSKRKKALIDEGKNATIENIILTSEDSKIVAGRLNFTRSETFPFDFIVNENDAGQGSGYPRDFKEGTADNIMFSSLVSLQMQMRSESLIVNQCSNFHRLMVDFAGNGCGAQNYVEEYKDNDNPLYRMTCRW